LKESEDRIQVRVKRLHAKAKIPLYAHSGKYADLAADLSSVEDCEVQPGEVVAIATGLALQFPPGFGAIIENRSGLSLEGIAVLGGVIDPGYRGEVRVIIANVGRKRVVSIRQGQRIAQMRVVRGIAGEFVECSELEVTERQSSGFGSTGT